VLVNALLPFSASSLTEEHFYQLLRGVFTELSRWDVLLLGGHTAEASELALALVCNGLIDPAKIWRKSGLQPGQSLILTKALGTGALFAADMRGAVRPAAMQEALSSMLTPNAAAADIFAEHGATACTDVTGFGFIGHLSEMLRASQAHAQLTLRSVPCFAGALDCVRRGFVSSLQGQNQRAVSYVKNAADFRQHDAFPLLFDPQTSGGLIASVPASHAQDCIDQLRRTGHPHAAVVGTVQPLTAIDLSEELFISLT
jgi:selenide, water dikinase